MIMQIKIFSNAGVTLFQSLALIKSIMLGNNNTTSSSTPVVSPTCPNPLSPSVISSSNNKIDLLSNEMFPSLGMVGDSVNGGGSSTNNISNSISNGFLSKKSLEGYTEVFHLSFDQQRTLDPKKSLNLSSLCQIVGEQTRCTIDASRSTQSKMLTFLIKGSNQEQVLMTKRILWQKLAQNVPINVPVPLQFVGSIIGSGGSKLQALQMETNTRIRVPKKDDWNGNFIITGDYDAVRMAQSKLEAIIKEKSSRVSKRIEIDRLLMPFVWNEEFFKEGVTIDQRIDGITLAGDRELVKEAEEYWEMRVRDIKSSIRTIFITIPKGLHRRIIGHHGTIKNSIELKHHAIITIPERETSNENIKIVALDEGIIGALQETLNIIKHLDYQVFSGPVNLLKAFKYDCIMKELELKNQGTIEISIVADGVSICGEKESVSSVIPDLQKIISEAEQLKFEIIPIDQIYLKSVLAQQGLEPRRLIEDHDIHIIYDEENPNHITIASANIESIERAKREFLSPYLSVCDFTRQVIPIERKYQKYLQRLMLYPIVGKIFNNDELVLLGPKQEVSSCMAELKIEVEKIKKDIIAKSHKFEIPLASLEMKKHADQGMGWIRKWCKENDLLVNMTSTNLVIQGYKERADEVGRRIKDRLDQIIDQTIVSFPVEGDYLSILIGKKGQNAKKLQERHSVIVRFPQDDDENKIITIKGGKRHAEAAKQEILDLISYVKKNHQREQIFVPNNLVSFIVGKNGMTIDMIAESTNTQLKLTNPSRFELVEGERERERGMNKMTIMTSGSHSLINGINSSNGSIGTGVGPKADESIITIEGSKEAIEEAKRAIRNIVSQQQSITEIQIEFDSWPKIIETALSALRLIEKKYSDSVKLSSIPQILKTKVAILRGSKEAVEAMQEEISNLLNRSNEYKSVQVSIPTRRHGKLMGIRGERIKELAQTFNVSIHFPRSNDNIPLDLVTISGLSDNVDSAMEILLKNSMSNDTNSTISTFTSTSTSTATTTSSTINTVVNNGINSIETKNTSSSISSALPSSSISSHEEQREIYPFPKDKHALIIGKGGQTIKELQEATGCKIVVPSVKIQSDTILLKGTEQGILKAKEALENLINANNK